MTEINRDDKRHSCNITLEHFVKVISEAVQKKFPTLQDESNRMKHAESSATISGIWDITLNPYYYNPKYGIRDNDYLAKMTPEQINHLKDKLSAVKEISATISKEWGVEIMPMSIITSSLAFLHQEVVDRVDNKYPSMNIFVEKVKDRSNNGGKFKLWFENNRTDYYQVTLNGRTTVAKYAVETRQAWDGKGEDHFSLEINMEKLALERFPLSQRLMKEAVLKLIDEADQYKRDVTFSGDPSRIALPREDLEGKDYSAKSMQGFYRLDVGLTPLEEQFEIHLKGSKGSLWYRQNGYVHLTELSGDGGYDSFKNDITITDSNEIPLLTKKDINDKALKLSSKNDFVELLRKESLLSYDLPEYISKAIVNLLSPDNEQQRQDIEGSAKLSVAHALYHLRSSGLDNTYVDNSVLQNWLDIRIKQNDLEALSIQCSFNNPALMSLVLYSSDNVEDCCEAGKAAIAMLYDLLCYRNRSSQV